MGDNCYGSSARRHDTAPFDADTTALNDLDLRRGAGRIAAAESGKHLPAFLGTTAARGYCAL